LFLCKIRHYCEMACIGENYPYYILSCADRANFAGI
jgi:hypothetical protein